MKKAQKKAVDNLVDGISRGFEDWLARLEDREDVEGKAGGGPGRAAKCSECSRPEIKS